MAKLHTIIPHLTFSGNCAEALETYMQAFGGEVYWLSRWTEATAEHPSQAGKVMHAEFSLGSTRMAASDGPDQTTPAPCVKLMVHMDTMEEALSAIGALADGGSVLSPLRPHPAPDDSGCGSITRDRFGYTWIITCPNPARQPSHNKE